MTGPLDRDTVEQVVRHLARFHLEVERGLRSRDGFASQLPPSARLAYLRMHRHDPRMPSGVPTDADVHSVRIEQHASGRVYATAVTTTIPGRHGALSFVLEARDDKVALLQVVRLQARGVYAQQRPSPPADVQASNDRQRDLVRDIRDHAAAARRDLARRLDTVADDDARRPGLQRDHDTWTQLHDYYDQQYRQLGQHDQQRSPNPIRDRRRH